MSEITNYVNNRIVAGLPPIRRKWRIKAPMDNGEIRGLVLFFYAKVANNRLTISRQLRRIPT
jgi:hypothetical protein